MTSDYRVFFTPEKTNKKLWCLGVTFKYLSKRKEKFPNKLNPKENKYASEDHITAKLNHFNILLILY